MTDVPATDRGTGWRGVLKALGWFALLITGFGLLLHSCSVTTPPVVTPPVTIAPPKPVVTPPCNCDKPVVTPKPRPKPPVAKPKPRVKKKPADKPVAPTATQSDELPRNWRERNTGLLFGDF